MGKHLVTETVNINLFLGSAMPKNLRSKIAKYKNSDFFYLINYVVLFIGILALHKCVFIKLWKLIGTNNSIIEQQRYIWPAKHFPVDINLSTSKESILPEDDESNTSRILFPTCSVIMWGFTTNSRSCWESQQIYVLHLLLGWTPLQENRILEQELSVPWLCLWLYDMSFRHE